MQRTYCSLKVQIDLQVRLKGSDPFQVLDVSYDADYAQCNQAFTELKAIYENPVAPDPEKLRELKVAYAIMGNNFFRQEVLPLLCIGKPLLEHTHETFGKWRDCLLEENFLKTTNRWRPFTFVTDILESFLSYLIKPFLPFPLDGFVQTLLQTKLLAENFYTNKNSEKLYLFPHLVKNFISGFYTAWYCIGLTTNENLIFLKKAFELGKLHFHKSTAGTLIASLRQADLHLINLDLQKFLQALPSQLTKLDHQFAEMSQEAQLILVLQFSFGLLTNLRACDLLPGGQRQQLLEGLFIGITFVDYYLRKQNNVGGLFKGLRHAAEYSLPNTSLARNSSHFFQSFKNSVAYCKEKSHQAYDQAIEVKNRFF